MARRPTLRRRLEAITRQWEPRVAEAFLAAMADIADQAEIGRIAEALERRDINAALRAIHLDPAAFRDVEETLRLAYGAGGAATASTIPTVRDPSGNRVVVRFDMRAPRAERYLSRHTAQLVTRVTDDTRVMLRNAMTAGLERGTNPRTIALDLVGRIDRRSNRRVGGLIGLTSPQERAADTARAALLSGDREGMRAYLGYQRRDRRFDGAVLRALRDETGLDQTTVNRIIGRYNDRLLILRGETIARTEVLTAVHASKAEAFEQFIDTGAVQRQQVKKVWIALRDEASRPDHAAANGERVGIDERFSTGLLYPHEPGAPAESVVSCRCDYEIIVDFLAGLE